jgi:hypothetical protein
MGIARMCDRCLGVTRRELLKLTAAGVAVALAGCSADPAVSDLPDVYDDHLVEGRPGPVRVDPRRIVVPPPTAAQRSEYGDIMPRSAWIRLPLQFKAGQPMDGVRRVTVHHSGDGKPFTGEAADDVARHLQIVQQAHLQRGMVDIAYHFAVDRTGRLWQLRWLGYEGQHVRPSKTGVRNNEHNVGIVVLGDFNLQSPTVPQRDRLLALVRLVRSKYALPPSAVAMHGEIVETDCPGKSLRPLLVDARRHNLL